MSERLGRSFKLQPFSVAWSLFEAEKLSLVKRRFTGHTSVQNKTFFESISPPPISELLFQEQFEAVPIFMSPLALFDSLSLSIVGTFCPFGLF